MYTPIMVYIYIYIYIYIHTYTHIERDMLRGDPRAQDEGLAPLRRVLLAHIMIC